MRSCVRARGQIERVHANSRPSAKVSSTLCENRGAVYQKARGRWRSRPSLTCRFMRRGRVLSVDADCIHHPIARCKGCVSFTGLSPDLSLSVDTRCCHFWGHASEVGLFSMSVARSCWLYPHRRVWIVRSTFYYLLYTSKLNILVSTIKLLGRKRSSSIPESQTRNVFAENDRRIKKNNTTKKLNFNLLASN